MYICIRWICLYLDACITEDTASCNSITVNTRTYVNVDKQTEMYEKFVLAMEHIRVVFLTDGQGWTCQIFGFVEVAYEYLYSYGSLTFLSSGEFALRYGYCLVLCAGFEDCGVFSSVSKGFRQFLKLLLYHTFWEVFEYFREFSSVFVKFRMPVGYFLNFFRTSSWSNFWTCETEGRRRRGG